MQEALGDPTLTEFRQLSEVHRDGWGAVWIRANQRSAYTTNRRAAADQAMFRALTDQAVDAAMVHERWASPGIGLSLDHQQPFSMEGVAFAHNGTIANEEGNIVQKPTTYRESLGLRHSTTRSDSKIFAELFLLRLHELRQSPDRSARVEDVRQALALTITRLRQDYPDAGFNNVIQTPDFTLVTRAHPSKPTYSDGLIQGYMKAGWSARIDSYYQLKYTTISHSDGSTTNVASSSGYPSSDPWTELANDSILVLTHIDPEVRILPLGIETPFKG